MKYILVFLITLTFCGCGAKDSGTKNGGTDTAINKTPHAAAETAVYWKTETRPQGEYLIDGEGNEIPLRQYKRMVVLSPGAVETLYLIGGETAIAAIASSSDPVWPAEKTSQLPAVGNVARPNLEAVVSMEPDLVIGNAMNSAFIADYIARGGGQKSAAIIHGSNSLDDILESALLLGKLCGREAEARELVRQKREIITTLTHESHKNTSSLKGAFLYQVNPVMAFNAASLAGNVLEILGVENIAARLPAAQPILSPEYLVTQNPDFLFGAMSISKPEDILGADSAILKTRAGREGNINIIPSSYFLRPSPRLVDKLPELYREIQVYAGQNGEKQK